MRNLTLLQSSERATGLLADGRLIATIYNPEYENLLVSAENLKLQLEVAIFILENLPDVNIDVSGMKTTVEEAI